MIIDAVRNEMKRNNMINMWGNLYKYWMYKTIYFVEYLCVEREGGKERKAKRGRKRRRIKIQYTISM